MYFVAATLKQSHRVDSGIHSCVVVIYLFLSFCESWMCHYMHMFTASPPSPTDMCSKRRVSLPVKMRKRLSNDRPALSRPHTTIYRTLQNVLKKLLCFVNSIHSFASVLVRVIFYLCFSLLFSSHCWKWSLFCLCMSWMCLQLHFKTNSLQPEFNSKKKESHTTSPNISISCCHFFVSHVHGCSLYVFV